MATRTKVLARKFPNGMEVVHRGEPICRIEPGRGVVVGVVARRDPADDRVLVRTAPRPGWRPVDAAMPVDSCIPAAVYDAAHPPAAPSPAAIDAAARAADPVRARLDEALRKSLATMFPDVAAIERRRIKAADEQAARAAASSVSTSEVPAVTSGSVPASAGDGPFKVGDRVRVGRNGVFCPLGEGVLIENLGLRKHHGCDVWRVHLDTYDSEPYAPSPWRTTETSLTLVERAAPPSRTFKPGDRVVTPFGESGEVGPIREDQAECLVVLDRTGKTEHHWLTELRPAPAPASTDPLERARREFPIGCRVTFSLALRDYRVTGVGCLTPGRVVLWLDSGGFLDPPDARRLD